MYNKKIINKLNDVIKENFTNVSLIEPDYNITFSGVSRMVMLDRYSQKDSSLQSLGNTDVVILTLKEDKKYPTKAIGRVVSIDKLNNLCTLELDDEYKSLSDEKIIIRGFNQIEKPLELFYEQISKRVAITLASNENVSNLKNKYSELFYEELKNMHVIPAGRILYGAGSKNQVTYFNCYVMPFIHDSRIGISKHRQEVMEIMSRGGGVGTNGSTLRPAGAIAKSVGGKSSGAVSWLNDIANLTNLVEQGGSRRGAQMIMLADWHPDIIEFIISKIQNAKVLKWLSENSDDIEIKIKAKNKLKKKSLSLIEEELYKEIVSLSNNNELKDYANKKLINDGEEVVEDREYLSGANISVAISNTFMEKVESDGVFSLCFPDLENYSTTQKEDYDNMWQEIGDVYVWERMGYPIKTYRTIKARALWELICFCSTYSAEPGVFFIDNANEDTNATGYGQRVVATNPCGEQPLAPYSVCNLAAINLSKFINKKNGIIDYNKLKRTVELAVRMQDNVIDCTPYFLSKNKEQALGERRIGLGVMGLHDLLLYSKVRYGSEESLIIVDKLFEHIANYAYGASIELAKEKGSFPFLLDREKFISAGFIKKMPNEIKSNILKYGIRNSHLLTIAPTGSTGTMLNVSTGLEPYFSFKYYRSGRLGKFMEVNAQIVDEFLENNDELNGILPSYFVSAMDLEAMEHAKMQCCIQKWVDSSISKTVNAPKEFTVTKVQEIYEYLYKHGAKGATVYVDGSRDGQVLTLSSDNKKKKKRKPIYRFDRMNRNIGNEIGEICPLCNEGIIQNIGGCNTCTNCNVQLKCGL